MGYRLQIGAHLMGQLFDAIRQNFLDCLSLMVVTTGTVLSFYDRSYHYGQMAVGLIIGLYFSWDISLWGNMRQCLREQGFLRTLFIVGLFVTLIVSAPYLAIGVALGLAIRKVIAMREA